MEPLQAPKCVMIITGEASGDLHGSRLVRAMRKRSPDLFFCGIGGKFLREAGVRILVEAASLSVVGLTEAISKIPVLAKGMGVVKKLLKSLRPDLLILIDFPDFNLHAAAIAKKLDIPVLYYISPQIWAWRSGRINKIKKLVDHVAVILPFERDLYAAHDIPVTFVGHPLLDGEQYANSPEAGATVPDHSTIGLLPGSREREILRHLPIMLSAARQLIRQTPNLKFAVSLAPTVTRELVDSIIKTHGSDIKTEIISEGVDQVFKRCGFAIVVSGTVSLEAAISGTPMVIIYRVSLPSYWMGRALIQVRYMGLVNLIADREIVPELVQGQAFPENIAAKVTAMLGDAAGLDQLRKELRSAVGALGGPGASDRTAAVAMALLEK
ncbi:MAG: lipid-A-disaccharide synthase [Desulfobacterales bacterium]|nr:lipid-A-disaccharide synthase [Desulfobacterales bacterium]